MKYVLLRREFIDWVNNKTEIPAIARRVLVTMGGSDSENYTLKVIQALQKVEIPGLEATVVVGASNINADILEATAKRSRIPIHLIRDARDMPKLMAWADVAVSAGGSTCWELAFMGLPSIILVIADNQKANSEALRDTRMALVLDITSGVTKIRLLLQELLQNRELRKNMSQVAGTAVDRLGAQRIVAHMMTNVDFA
jgi:spore coat polysaccharide biosynthesis predicted glycosyltransferase SpsG